MSIRAFPMTRQQAEQTLREARASDPDGRYDIVGRGNALFVRMHRPDGSRKIIGREQQRLRKAVKIPRHVESTKVENERLMVAMSARQS